MALQTLSRFWQRPALPLLTALAILSGWAGLAGARTQPFGERVEIKVVLPPAPARTDTIARRSIATLDKAALLACGGSDVSLREMKAAVRQSSCWHEAMTRALVKADDPKLIAWWAAHHS